MTTIKKIILLALTVLIVVGCDIRTEKTKRGDWPIGKSFSDIAKERRHKRDSLEQKWHGCDVVILDSCEYIRKELIGYKKAAYALVHKGNCRFCKERRQKELEELVIKLKEK